MPARRESDRPERIGILGGTFDPPHVGHVAAARAVQAALSLDRLLLVVANDPWQKSPTRVITPAEDRFAMTEALAEDLPGVEASRMEIDRGGPSYTVMTVEAILAEAESEADASGDPDAEPPEIFLVVGADLVPDLGTWERVADLKELVTLAVVSRPPAEDGGILSAPWGWRVEWIDGPQVDVSSSAVRQALAQGESVTDLVPEAVIRCMARRDLYAVRR
ncbi:MAG TPA: nicotinate (nicotinamide) nucleotide adenylyltransferase [Acidimicrobiales bacterium]|nr:nicotinate (nicotinamide) nucleotide adenylyltransferase [Acidimicrobiales bacterium]